MKYQLAISTMLLLLLAGCGAKDLEKSLDRGATRLDSLELRRIIAGSTVLMEGYDDDATIQFFTNGKMTAENDIGEKNDGVWSIDDQERLCMQFQRWGHGDRICYNVYQHGNRYKQFNDSGTLLYSFEVLENGGGGFEEGIVIKRNDEGQATDSASGQAGPSDNDQLNVVPYDSPQAQADIDFIVRNLAQNCPGCNLVRADLHGMNLNGANLEGSNLAGANLSQSNLRKANLRGANLYNTNLNNANLRGADLTGANLTGANLEGAETSGAVGLK